jgi:hypothetical protein
MPELYVNTKGTPHRKHSYSAGNDYTRSPYLYYLKRIMGWREKDDMARFMFGRAIEKSVEFYHDNNGQGIIEKFKELWAPVKEIPNLVFTKVEKDWETLNRMGIDMCKLYVIRQPDLPIPLGGSSVFQREYAKEVFPGDPLYGEIQDAGKLDIVCYVDPCHPLLTPVKWKPEYGLLRPLIVDMKTAGQDYDERPGMPAFDDQLRRYSWQSGIRDVAFLAFVKKSLGYKKNSKVTLLTQVNVFKAGTEMIVAGIDNGKDEMGKGVWLVSSQMAADEADNAQGYKEDESLDTTKAAKARRQAWLEENAYYVTESSFTRQKLQFNSGFVTTESANEIGIIAGKQIVQIVNSWKNNEWPNAFGIRYPHDDRRDPYFRAFVMKDENYKNEHFKLAPAENDDLFDEDEPEPEEGQ